MIEDKKEMHRALFEYLHSRIVLDDELEKFYETFVWEKYEKDSGWIDCENPLL